MESVVCQRPLLTTPDCPQMDAVVLSPMLPCHNSRISMNPGAAPWWGGGGVTTNSPSVIGGSMPISCTDQPLHLTHKVAFCDGRLPAHQCTFVVGRQVVHKRHKIRFEPFEWVYDGLKPLLLPDILQTKKGMSHSLAALYCCVARRAGLALIPVPINTTGGETCLPRPQISQTCIGNQRNHYPLMCKDTANPKLKLILTRLALQRQALPSKA